MMYNKQHGYSIVETLVAVSVLLVAIVGPITIAVRSIQSAYYTQELTTAVFLAQEGIEAVAAERNRHLLQELNTSGTDYWGWATNPTANMADCFISNGNFKGNGANSGCNFDFSNPDPFASPVADCQTTANCALQVSTSGGSVIYELGPGTYTREVMIYEDGGERVIIESTVNWTSQLFGGDRSVTLHTELYNEFRP